jgi:hypothetical protein
MGVKGSSAVVPHDSNGCRNGSDGAHESCKPPAISRQIAVGPAYDERFARFHFHQKLVTGALRAAFQGTLVKSIRNYSALASPSNLRHVRFVLQIVKLTWMRPIAKGPLPTIPTPVRSNHFDCISRRARSEIGAECLYHVMSGHRILPRWQQPFLSHARGANAPIGLQRQPKPSAKCDGLTNRRQTKRSRRTWRYRRLRTAPPIQARFDRYRSQVRYRSRPVTDGLDRCTV